MTACSEVTTAPTTPVRHDVTCTDARMEFSIPFDGQGSDVQTATLSDPRCRATVDTAGGRLVGSANLNGCGTTVAFTNDSVIFRNVILLSYPSIRADEMIPLECKYDRFTTVQLNYMPVVRHVLFTEAGIGQLSFRIQQYNDASFSSAVPNNQYPLRVQPEEDVYIQLSMGSGVSHNTSDGIGLMVQECVASPFTNLMQAQDNFVPLIRDSCPASPDVHMLPSTPRDVKQVRFMFRAVSFPHSAGVVYVLCRVGLCPYQSCPSYTDDCPAIPAPHRARRAIMDDEPNAGTHQLSTGPLLVQASGGSASASSATVLTAVSMIVAAAATVVAMVALVAWRRSRRRNNQEY